MSAPPELKLLRSIKTGKGLQKLIKSLKLNLKESKVKEVKRKALTKKQREAVLAKTDGRCHMCGIEIDINNFHADHVKSHITGGVHEANNYLPSCSTCNNLRWHYSSEEIQIILKLGRWLKTRVTKEDELALTLANEFIKHEMTLRNRKKS
ncbi:MAG: HNH endonuclease [Bacteroidota bacterium]|nr:HNH endonuclease [Bacteroidota bacterium]